MNNMFWEVLFGFFNKNGWKSWYFYIREEKKAEKFARDKKIYYFSTKAPHDYCAVKYPDEVWLMFGKETKGIPEDILYAHYDDCVRIPMRENLRSLNLSNAAAIAVYEVLRQHNFEGLVDHGKMK